ncbi:terminase small subunit [Alkalihalobacterium chitinilyticum]|uniref:Terminase small subunit n=1 Tax=Alkalihalobacterium chitinilyticum TaxID=2980103 RepID=A0ABT5VJ96_9BACI|nr:terminase small subunit [Alkalihalobacterium chitinilyticum]MDE5415494.1 terminase small subunit [Alkalihalobacterium chitinilyticum]
MTQLNKKQELFCHHYVRTLNASLSARLAGYANNHNSGYRVMNMPGVKEKIEELFEEKKNNLVKNDTLIQEKLHQLAMGLDDENREISKQNQLKAIEMLYRFIFSDNQAQGPLHDITNFIEALTGSNAPTWNEEDHEQ